MFGGDAASKPDDAPKANLFAPAKPAESKPAEAPKVSPFGEAKPADAKPNLFGGAKPDDTAGAKPNLFGSAKPADGAKPNAFDQATTSTNPLAGKPADESKGISFGAPANAGDAAKPGEERKEGASAQANVVPATAVDEKKESFLKQPFEHIS